MRPPLVRRTSLRPDTSKSRAAGLSAALGPLPILYCKHLKNPAPRIEFRRKYPPRVPRRRGILYSGWLGYVQSLNADGTRTATQRDFDCAMPLQNHNKHREATTPTQRSAPEIALLTALSLSAIGAFAALLIRLLLLDWPPYKAIPVGCLVGFVLVSILLIVLGRTTVALLVTAVVIIIAVAVLWSLPERIRAMRALHDGRQGTLVPRHPLLDRIGSQPLRLVIG